MNPAPCPSCVMFQEQVMEKDKKIVELQAQAVQLRYELNEVRDKWFSRRKKKQDPEVEPEPKKRGAKPGHPGWYRPEPAKIDHTEEVTLDICPDCKKANLSSCGDIEEHVQEDITLPEVKVTCFRRHSYWCRNCKKVVSRKGDEEVPNSIIGPKAKAVAAFLKYEIKVSERDIQKLFKELCNLKIAASSIPGFHNQLRKKGQSLYELLKEQIKKAPYLHADETGAPLDGKKAWDWVFATTHICLHVLRQSRGQKVVEEILGKRYEGILLSDFLSAYHALDAKAKQRCLIHLLRDLKKALECSEADDPVHVYCQRLKDLIQSAIDLQEQWEAKTILPETFESNRKTLEESLADFQFPDPQKGILRRMSKRLGRHRQELFTFLKYPELHLPYHNNHAERLIRPSVILRKITFGHRSPKGQENHSVIMSLHQTAHLNGKPTLPLFHKLMTASKPPSLDWCLSAVQAGPSP